MATRNFHWSSVLDCVMFETDSSGNTTVSYTHEPQRYGALLSENRGGTEYYHYYDALESTVFMTVDAGTISDTFQYDAWGTIVSRTGSTNATYLWCGRSGYESTSAASAYYVRARVYLPEISRWMSCDPQSFSIIRDTYSAQLLRSPTDSGFAAESSRTIDTSFMVDQYCYVDNNPVGGFDPTGTVARSSIALASNSRATIYDFGYGNYCGPTRRATCDDKGKPVGGPAPVDALDRLCQSHDCCLATISKFLNPITYCTCNAVLCLGAHDKSVCAKSRNVFECVAYTLLILNSPFCKKPF